MRQISTARSATKTRKHERLFLFRAFVSSWLFLGAVLGSDAAAQGPQTRTRVETLASPRLEGRLAGSNGEKLAADYLVAQLQKIGGKPLPGQTDLRLPFQF